VSFRWPVDRLRFKDPIPAGMNPYVLRGLVPLLRGSNEDHDAISVGEPCPACGTADVLDGRHRWIASVIAGRPDVLANAEDPATFR
jgi:hypothetical protein